MISTGYWEGRTDQEECLNVTTVLGTKQKKENVAKLNPYTVAGKCR